MNFNDPTGHFGDTILDIISIGAGIYDIHKNGLNWSNGLGLAADVVGLALPFVTGGGAIVKLALKSDNITDIAKNADEAVTLMTKAGDKIKDLVGAYCSFSDDTEVMTKDGPKPISEIELGDYVLAFNEETGETGYYPVTAVWSHLDEEIVYMLIDGEIIVTTPDHPFYTSEGEWVAVEDLEFGDRISTSDEEFGTVLFKYVSSTEQFMYNLTVDDAHTYFVGSGEWLVHNDCGAKTPKDLFAFGNTAGPRAPRPGADFNVSSAMDNIGPEFPPMPKGASTFADPMASGLTGQYHKLPAGTKLPKGFGVVADGSDVLSASKLPPTHHSIFPKVEMLFQEFSDEFVNLPWEHVGKIK
ncbi:MAG: HINT domain-containing protein [Anaerolineae bacterium]|nr:HINT domain-containing protein [Anaerolineae bacterium]